VGDEKECTMSPIRTAAAVAGASFAAIALAGCSGGAAASGPSHAASGSGSSSSASASSASSSSSASGSKGASGGLKDGSYTARGDYTSPGGASAVDVAVTLKSGTVTALKVTPKAENPTAKGYEAQFASGVGTKVIGKKLTDLNVTKVSGSSLTSQGFDRAIAAIEKHAAA
jgi:uncharacterized protein with FMN-binding domain